MVEANVGMGSVDPFGRTDKLGDAMLEALAVRFEARGSHPMFSRMLDEYLDAMDIGGAGTVLDIGCGTGLAARAIARRASFAGQVTGIDLSPFLVGAAGRLAAEEGLAERTEFRTGDTRHLEAAGGTFDAVVAHTLLSHVEDPLSVIKEAARVLKPGGMLGIFDGDYASLTFDNEDPAAAKTYDEALINAVVTNPRVMRRMPRLLRKAGLELVTSFSYVLCEIGQAAFWASAVEAYRRLIPQTGRMTEGQADAWAAALRKDSSEGVFFASCNYYSYVAKRR
jgi:ubiquinone/menaquinone biosynthesis C-methylase UbiE